MSTSDLYEVSGLCGTAVVMVNTSGTEWIAVLTRPNGERWVSDAAYHPARAQFWAERLAQFGSWKSARAQKVCNVISRWIARDWRRI